jgi:molybdopterin molybdotransferase
VGWLPNRQNYLEGNLKVQISDDCFAVDDRLMTTAEALSLLSDRINPIGISVTLTLRQSKNHVLAEDVKSDYDVPPRGNSAVDGYAFAF